MGMAGKVGMGNGNGWKRRDGEWLEMQGWETGMLEKKGWGMGMAGKVGMGMAGNAGMGNGNVWKRRDREWEWLEKCEWEMGMLEKWEWKWLEMQGWGMGMAGKAGMGNGNAGKVGMGMSGAPQTHSQEAGEAGMGWIPDPRAPDPIPGKQGWVDPRSHSRFPQELTTVRVQDPRVQNEGSWNSYVDYKIFLHTNSKAFTAKTSCVRRRYREFVWLRRQLQRNAGSVPVPELPGKSAFFVGSTDEFIERRRQGLQHFLERVVQSAVLLSDSRLHLFLQSQLPVPAIEACVQGRGPRSVTDAILHYAMAGPAWGQRGDGAGMGAASCAGLGSARGCLESFPCWTDFGMDEARPDSPAGQRVTPPDSPAGQRVTPPDMPRPRSPRWEEGSARIPGMGALGALGMRPQPGRAPSLHVAGIP
uniref:PX domain-containing protein n=1 Tax=Taeniopygia guttata TaxID=59729 RepID=A0A674HF55_TAEGU